MEQAKIVSEKVEAGSEQTKSKKDSFEVRMGALFLSVKASRVQNDRERLCAKDCKKDPVGTARKQNRTKEKRVKRRKREGYETECEEVTASLRERKHIREGLIKPLFELSREKEKKNYFLRGVLSSNHSLTTSANETMQTVCQIPRPIRGVTPRYNPLTPFSL